MPVPSSLTFKDEEKVVEKSSSCSPSPPDSPPALDQNNKLFVGALNLDTTEESLTAYFEKFGDIQECTIMKDHAKRSRGFGFITFKESDTVQKILKEHSENPLIVDDKPIDPKLAVPKRNHKPTPITQVRRIFVGGLSSDTDEDDMKDFFSKFGEIEEVQLMYDKHTNRHRGFGFVTFMRPAPAAKVCSIQFHDLKNKKVEVKVAQTKEALAQQADKARAVVYNHGYASPAFSYSPNYPQFYPHYPMAYYPGYGYHGDHHLPSPPFYPSGFNGLPGPYFMRGMHDPSSLPINSPDYISDHFQGLAIMSPFMSSPTGSPPHGFPLTPSSYASGGNDAIGSTYSTSNGLSPKGGSSPNNSPINCYTQVPSYQPSSQTNSYSLPQQKSSG